MYVLANPRDELAIFKLVMRHDLINSSEYFFIICIYC